MKVPQLSKNEIQDYLDASGVTDEICIVGIRGYYADTFGKPNENDRGFYDDAIFVISPQMFTAFQANVDPSIFRKGIATLKIGIYKAVKHFHHGKYKALQIVRDVVERDGQAGEDVGRHGINFHYGSDNATWSEGCQTLPRSTYTTFIKLVYSLMDANDLSEITYLLIDNK